jgi:hypothetical protein
VCKQITTQGLTLSFDLDEVAATGEVILHVVHTATCCGHPSLTPFEGFGHSYPAPRRCERCRHKHRTGLEPGVLLEDVLVAAGMQ